MQIPLAQALEKLAKTHQPFAKLFTHGTLSVKIYKPVKKDLQTPHEKDEVYVVITGREQFFNNGHTVFFQPGNLLFVPAGIEPL